MRLITFDPFRTLGCPDVHYIKPAQLMNQREQLENADGILFPDYADIHLVSFALGKPVFPSLASYLLGFDKVEMTRAFQLSFPAHVPHTIMLPNEPRYQARILESMDFPFVAKLTRASMGEGVYLIEAEHDWHHYCSHTDMLYVQEKLDIDRDLRIVWIGDRIVHAYWRVAAPGAFHNNLAHGGSIELDNIPEAALNLVTSVATRFGIDYAGFDVAMVGGHPYLFEFNRLFGLEGLNRARINTGAIISEYLSRKWSGTGATQPTGDTPSGPARAA